MLNTNNWYQNISKGVFWIQTVIKGLNLFSFRATKLRWVVEILLWICSTLLFLCLIWAWVQYKYIERSCLWLSTQAILLHLHYLVCNCYHCMTNNNYWSNEWEEAAFDQQRNKFVIKSEVSFLKKIRLLFLPSETQYINQFSSLTRDHGKFNEREGSGKSPKLILPSLISWIESAFSFEQIFCTHHTEVTYQSNSLFEYCGHTLSSNLCHRESACDRTSAWEWLIHNSISPPKCLQLELKASRQLPDVVSSKMSRMWRSLIAIDISQ